MSWLGRLLRRNRMEERLDRELRFHLEQHSADLISQGHDPAQARREARLALGGPDQVKEQCRDARGTRWLEDFAQDLRYAFRSLWKNPAFAAVALGTLALGIGATTVMFTVVRNIILAPLPYSKPARLVAVHVRFEKAGDGWPMSYPNFKDVQTASRTLDTVAAWTWAGFTLSDPPLRVDARLVSAGFFPVLGVRLAEGRAFLPEEDKPSAPLVVILSYKLWQERFGGRPEAIGSRMVMDGAGYTIVGVAPAGFQLEGATDVYTPLGHYQDPRMFNRAATFIHVIGRLANGVSLPQAQAELAAIGTRLAEQYPRINSGSLLPVPLNREVVGDVSSTIWLLFGAVAFVLLIACANIASLLLARAVSRENELAMRAALGAGRGRLVRQCLTESALLGIVGGLLGLLIAAVGTPAFLSFWPEQGLPRAGEVHIDWLVLAFALATSLACSLLFGLAPALRASLRRSLHSGARSASAGTRRLHGAFVSAELALTVVLLVCAGILGRTMLRLSSLDPGFRLQGVMAARVAMAPGVDRDPARVRAVWRDMLERSKQVPGVDFAAAVDVVPMRNGINVLSYGLVPNLPPSSQKPALSTATTPDYLRVMGIPLLHGRFFNDQDKPASEPVIVIDSVMAQRAFPGQDPTGRRIWVPALGPGPVTVIGMVGHVRHWGLAGDDAADVRDQLYYPLSQVPDSLMALFARVTSLAVHSSSPSPNLLESVQSALHGDPLLFDATSMDQAAADSLARQRFLLTLFGAFSSLALLLACIGIYGVLSYLTRQRVPEIGVRMALGASSADIRGMILRQSLTMIVAGVALGMAGAIEAARLLQKLVQGVGPTSPSTYMAMLALLAAAALLASFLPARRASRIDPLTALRQE